MEETNIEKSMKIHRAATYNAKGELITVFECESCGRRSIFPGDISACERRHKDEYHEEEFEAGIL